MCVKFPTCSFFIQLNRKGIDQRAGTGKKCCYCLAWWHFAWNTDAGVRSCLKTLLGWMQKDSDCILSGTNYSDFVTLCDIFCPDSIAQCYLKFKKANKLPKSPVVNRPMCTWFRIFRQGTNTIKRTPPPKNIANLCVVQLTKGRCNEVCHFHDHTS